MFALDAILTTQIDTWRLPVKGAAKAKAKTRENAQIKLNDGTIFTLDKPDYKRANSAAVKEDKTTKRKSTESPFNPDQLEFLRGTMNATAHMASNGNVGDEYIPGSAGPKSTKKAKAMDKFIAGWAQSFEQ